MPTLTHAPAAALDAPQREQATTAATVALAARLRGSLAYLARQWPDLLDPSRPAGQGGSAVAGSRVPLLTEALHLRVQVPTVIAGWAHYAHRALGLCPTHAALVALLPAGDVPALAAWLAPHCEALADDPTAAVVADELDHLAAQVAALLTPDGAVTIAVPALRQGAPSDAEQDQQQAPDALALAEAAGARGATCPWPGCPGTLAMHAGDARTTAIVCAAHSGHRWEQHEWVVLARSLGDATPARMSSGQLADWLSAHLQARIPRRTVLSWAARYPTEVTRGADQLFDRLAVAQWYLTHRARTTARG